MTRSYQGAFNGGILSPAMYSRKDISKYNSGMKDAKNLVVIAEGGVENRAGTEPAGGFDTSDFGNARQVLIPFEFSTADTYMLEFGDGFMRVLKNGGYVLDSAVAAQSVTSVSDANPAEITMVDATAAGNFAADDLAYFQDPNGSHFLHQQIVRVTAVASAVISFEVYDQTAIDATTNTTVLGSGATLSKVYQVAHPFTLADVPELGYAQDVDTLYIVHEDYDVRTLARVADDDWTFATATFVATRSPFGATGAGNRPSVVTFIEQRLALAATLNSPQAVDMSSSFDPLDFNRSSPPADDEAISFTVRAQQLNRIAALVPNEPHFMLTTGAEWGINGGDQKGYLTPTNPIVRPRSYHGSARQPTPLLIGDAVLHVQGDGRTVRERLPGSKGPSPDLTLLARHLFKGRTITSWCYAQSPNSVVWVTLDDGTLLSLTYLIEHEVWGWTRHELGGTDAKALQVAAVREGSADALYLVVSRTVNGRTVRMTERMDGRGFTTVEDAYFVDAGFKTTLSTPSSTLRGFLHLRGEPAAVLADGNVLEGRSFDAFGGLDLGTYVAQTTISAGLSYDAFLTTLGVDFSEVQRLGSTVGRYKATSDVAVEVEDTRGIAVGREDGPLNEVKEFTGAAPIPLATKTHLVTVEGDWQRDARITVAQNYPLPMRVTGVAPDWELEDG